MPVYAKKVDSSHETFKNRQTIISGGGEVSVIPVPDNVTLCNGCNQNISEGYLIYLSKIELKKGLAYDYYCENCRNRYFPSAIIV